MRLRSRRLILTVLAAALVLTACASDDENNGTDAIESDDRADVDPAEVASVADEPGDARPGSVCSPARSGVSDPDRSFDDGTGSRTYRLSVPNGWTGTEPAPLILDLHGLGSNADQEASLTGFEVSATALGYVVVTPNGATTPGTEDGEAGRQFWDITMEGNTDVTYLEALLDDLAAELCLDESAFFATGMSNGGGMSAVLACLSDRFAAVVPVAGLNINSGCRPDQPVTMVAFHGDADTIVAYDAELSVPEAAAEYAAAAGCEADPVVDQPYSDIEKMRWTGCGQATVEVYTVLGGGHTWPGLDLVADAGGVAAVAEDRGIPVEALAAILGNTTTSIDASAIALEVFEAQRLTSSGEGAGAD